MSERPGRLIPGELDRLTHEWWETAFIHVAREYVWDDEIKAVNAMTTEIDSFPDWALQVRGSMPRYGFEMCSHRWLDGLDDTIKMIGTETYLTSTAGRCGDVPGRVAAAAELRAAAVQAWVEDQVPRADGLDRDVGAWLGKRTAEKSEAATCYVEMIRKCLLGSGARNDASKRELAREWRNRGEANSVLAVVFQGEGLDGLLENPCGFKVVDRLDVYIRIIGGDYSLAGERKGVCNSQLRFVFRDDPARYETTRGYLWGLTAYLLGKDQSWLRSTKPECAGAAIYALHGVSRASPPTPLQRWLVASLLKSTKIWCQVALAESRAAAIPPQASDLPDVITAVAG